jgi:beta-galactosidase
MPLTRRHALTIATVAALTLAATTFTSHRTHAQQSSAPALPPISISGTQFVRAGQPFEIISGELHYARIPREYWRDRLRKAKAMGLNTIQVYAFWNAHEPRPGVFDFTGNLDVAEFLREARDQNLYVLMRLGPYVCAEWDAGGFPSWLYENPALQVRTTDPKFLAAAGNYLDHIGAELQPFLQSKGGPIIGFQIENEYGSYGPRAAQKGMGADPDATREAAHTYMSAIKQLFVHAGLGNEMFYTADGTDPEQMNMGELPGVFAAANFGPGEARTSIPKIQRQRPDQPVMVGEYWDGWFDAWGEAHNSTDTAQQLDEIKWFLSKNYSFNLYMVHGGTTWAFMNGANFDSGADGHYMPETTSYDYDAPIDEAGRPTKKYAAFRDAIAEHTGVKPPDVPQNLPLVAVPDFALTENAPLFKSLGEPVQSKSPLTAEQIGQIPGYGYTLYRTVLHGGSSVGPMSAKPTPAADAGETGSTGLDRPSHLGGNDDSAKSGDASAGTDLPSSASGDHIHINPDGSLVTPKRGLWGRDQIRIADVRSYAALYLNGRFIGSIDRRLGQETVDFDLSEDPATLDILVENTGRVNFGPHLPDGRTGIVGDVTLNGLTIFNWKMYKLPMLSPGDLTGKGIANSAATSASAASSSGATAAGTIPNPANASWAGAAMAAAPITNWGKHHPDGPSFYRGHFTMDAPADTFLDVSAIRKGFVWVNGHNAGRAWSIGPTRTLYIPAPWLVKGDNEVIAFDIFPDEASEKPAATPEPGSRPSRNKKLATTAGTPKTLRGLTDPIYIKPPVD